MVTSDIVHLSCEALLGSGICMSDCVFGAHAACSFRQALMFKLHVR